jgi:hypothetical protein
MALFSWPKAVLPGLILVATTFTVADAQEPLQKADVTADPIPQSDDRAYEPCGDPIRTGLCLSARISEVNRLSAGRFESRFPFCQLVFPTEPAPEEILCGELLVGLRPRAEWSDIRAIREAANGEWVRITGHFDNGPRDAQLRVEPGTERSALRNIIFHPMVRWVAFKRVSFPR